MTIECLCLADTVGSAQMLITKGSYEYDIECHTTMSKPTIYNSSGSSSDVAQYSTGFPTGAWHHCVMTYDKAGSFLDWWIDGVKRAHQTTLTVTASATGGAAFIGRRGDGAGTIWDGTIAHVAWYTSVLSDARIVAHYNAFVGGAP